MVESASETSMDEASFEIEKELLEKECEVARRKNEALSEKLNDMILGSRSRFAGMLIDEELREILRKTSTRKALDPGRLDTIDVAVAAFDVASKLDPVDLLGHAVRPVEVLAAIIVLAMIPPSMKGMINDGSIGDPTTVQHLVEMAGGLPA